MIKNSIKTIALVAILSTASCKHKEDFVEIRYDENNNVIAQDFSSNAISLQESIAKENKKKITDYPKLEFIDGDIFDFGDITEGQKVEHVFKFKNVGKTDLVVVHAQASCGCTVPDWTKRPILPGEIGEIKIVFNSKGKPGEQKKSITLTTNTEAGNEILKFRANVSPAKTNK